jgi:competence protein ComEC
LIHLVALSGYNVTIIAQGFHTIFRQIGPLGGFLFSLLGVWLFVLLVGAPPSLVRAAIMGSLLLLAEQLGRRRDIKRIVLLTAVIMVLPNPYILRYDIGFQLSFIATIAMIILVPLLTERIRKWPLPLALKEAAVSSFSAQIFVLPLLLLNFQKVALLAPLANVFVLPFIPLAMVVTFIIGVTGMLYLPLGQLGGVLGYLLLRYIILVGEFFGRLPWSQIETKTKGGWWPLFYWLIIYFAIKKIRQKWFK